MDPAASPAPSSAPGPAAPGEAGRCYALVSGEGRVLALHAPAHPDGSPPHLPDCAVGDDLLRALEATDEAGQALAQGARQVLGGEREVFLLEVSREDGGQRRDYELRVRPLPPLGALVEHEDVTAARRARERLELYQEVVGRANDAIGIVGPDGRYVEQNAAHQELLGYSDEELRGHTPAVHLGQEVFDDILEALLGEGVYRGESASETKDGRALRIDLGAFRVLDERGQLRCAVGIKRDVTERARLLERQRVLNALLQLGVHEGALVEKMHGCLLALLDTPLLGLGVAGGVFLREDDPAQLLLQAARGLEVDQHHELPADRCLCGRRLDPQALVRCPGDRGQEGPLVEAPHARVPITVGGRTQGALVVSLVEAPPREQVDGLLRAVAATLGGIIERHQTLAALRESEARLREIAASVPGAVYQLRVYPDGRRALPFVSDGFRELYGLLPEEVREDADMAFQALHPADRERVEEALLRSARSLGRWTDEFRIHRRPDGEVRWVHATSSPHLEADGSVVWNGVILDVTERKEAEAELEQAKETAEAAASAKAAFLANVSHEVRTPLNAIIGMTGLLLDTPLQPLQRDYAQTVRTSGDTLLMLINDLLDFSKVESGKMELERRPFGVRECVEEAMRLLAPLAAEKLIALAYLIDRDVPPTVVGDITRVRQVLVNLLSNAVKFTIEGQVLVQVSARPLPAEEGQAGQGGDEPEWELRFSVRDSGVGIPPERMDRLFKSFSQVDASTTRRFGGTGLGLAISKHLTELMGGRLAVESEVGEGSTFSFTILAPARPSQPGQVLDGPQRELQGRRTLIVDANPHAAGMLSEQLARWGAAPRVVGSGELGLEVVESGEDFDLLLLDQDASSAGRLLAALREHPRLADVPAVALTPVSAVAEDLSQGLPGAFAGAVTKPVRARELLETLTDVLSGRPHRVHGGAARARLDSQLGERRPARLLVAEDNMVNQKVTVALLEGMGYRPDVVANGVEVLEALARQSYDLVLMDVQMPEMDGLEAARRIAAEPPAGGAPRIVAMTASAMPGDRERCLDAGMDDYISKPIHPEGLLRALERWLNEGGSAPPVDLSLLEPLRAGGGEAVAELIDLFLDDSPPMLHTMRRAIRERDLEALVRAAHSLKGSSVSLGARRLSDLCLELEVQARGEVLERAPDLLRSIEAEYARVARALQEEREAIV